MRTVKLPLASSPAATMTWRIGLSRIRLKKNEASKLTSTLTVIKYVITQLLPISDVGVKSPKTEGI